MPTNILMPALSPTMTEGKLASWRKKEGDKVKAGDIIAEIETDKATMEVEAVDEGTLARIAIPAGTEGVKVNTVIAVLAEEGEDPKSIQAPAAAPPKATPSPPPSPQPPAPAAAPKAAAATAPQAAPQAASQPAPAPASVPGSGAARKANGEAGHADRAFVSPLAKRMAKQAGIDLRSLRGSGPHGRIVKADIDAALSGGTARQIQAPSGRAPAAGPAGVYVPSAGGMPPYEEIPHSNVRKIVAQRLTQAKRDAPHFYLSVDFTIDALLKLRADLNGRAPKDGPGAYKLSVNDFVIKAAALALMKVPAANASWTDTATRRYKSADISVAVAIPDGLITPIVRSAETKGLSVISNEMKDLAERARANKLKLEEFQGGTFSISNLGMYGIREFAAVINPPQACILAVGAGEQRPIVREGALAIATVMTCTLSTDHRVVDGAIGAEFMAAFKKLIEDPIQMML